MFTVEEESFNVIELSVTEKEPVLAEQCSWVFSVNSDSNITNVIFITRLRVGESHILETHSACEDNSRL